MSVEEGCVYEGRIVSMVVVVQCDVCSFTHA